ncbi:PREDICTED: uncharacterized protein LOC104585588 [Nelumbo nucifera]|uniref:Uncharacterized protein LOC104585588 n=2 Tax=Nelumbo nucifera TaxID=4432 RepID=A0A1U7YT32_NELNU|nr:PREDICTED: uncharacterized protein LOC104585588 [Nelumbo nucifera]DAD32910.1 TPA_asm: hypothetical protein HUJ06_011761 [Nelumbo nucifera]
MASDETMTIHYSSMHEDEDDVDYCIDEDDQQDAHHLHHHPSTLSRLSMCTSSSLYDIDDEDAATYMSRLSIEDSDDGDDADEELSDDKEGKGVSDVSSDSDKDPTCFSLPGTPPRRRIRRGSLSLADIRVKKYSSENEAEKDSLHRNTIKKKPNSSRRRITRERWLERAWEEKKKYNNHSKAVADEDVTMLMMMMENSNNNQSGDQSECVVITRPKGGRRSLCMDLEEVKACRDLGFELEHERMLEFPGRISISGSTMDTSSGSNSPIANWRISSPGDDPRDVKARLKVWAQAVALASAASRVVN